ncbi:TPA: type IV secretion protein Dot [Legionella pneumophila]|nr:type IV secretion protein Dot [Legionella pneumophila]HAT1919910.1 type IV secretion protein Dot [Legionella pneumophila]HAT4454821.1 type IV secretion protein Dot [Legionella pneumophila]HAT6367489.1 type IV secretion protein Dot [Legionella pneumophila]HAT6380485.1 type IV secretion protein Dot [Legionella pneumophila]
MFRQLSSDSRTKASEQWFKKQLEYSGLFKKISQKELEKSLPSVRVYYNNHYLKSPHDALIKIPAINVAGDRAVVFQDGLANEGKPDYFAKIPNGHPYLLSPRERLLAAKKIVYSDSLVFATGGYPNTNPLKQYNKPFFASIFSLAGANFEVPHQHATVFTLDQFNQSLHKSTHFSHLYDGVPTNFSDAKKAIGDYDTHETMSRIRVGLFTLLGRRTDGSYRPTLFKDSSIIFLTSPYFRHQLEDVSMLLSAVNEKGLEAGKPALLKATAVGMGFYAKIDTSYGIQHLLFPYYLRAYKKLLVEQSYPWIAEIEFPIFDEAQQEQFDRVFEDYKGPIKVYRSERDVLKLTEEEIKKYTPCILNPSDAFAYTGNEWGYGSVEAMIGNNTSLRIDQNPHTNPLLLDPNHHVGVKIKADYSTEFSRGSDLEESSGLKILHR